MAPLSFQSGLKFAKTLLPDSLMRSVSSVQTSICRHFLPSARPRCFKVCSSGRRRRRGLEATTLDELLDQASRVFMLSCHFLSLVLEDDGTPVDSEEFFQSLPGNTSLMVLEKGEVWTQNKVFPSFRQPRRDGVAKLSFELYKLHPKDFLCCLVVKATLYETYAVSYDFRCSRIKHVLRSLLRCIVFVTRLLGQLLLCTSSSLLQFTADNDG